MASPEGGSCGQLPAANSAIKEKSILAGLRVERAEIAGPGEFDHLTDDELERAVRERLVQLGFMSDAGSERRH